jgi:hypothetical protein
MDGGSRRYSEKQKKAPAKAGASAGEENLLRLRSALAIQASIDVPAAHVPRMPRFTAASSLS